MLNPDFRELIASFPQTLDALVSMPPMTIATLPPGRGMPVSGIYWFSEGSDSIYVGRSKAIRSRLMSHARPNAGHNSASFAFLLAREATGQLKASYTRTGSRADLERDPVFAQAFSTAKARIRAMDVRFVAEADLVRQCLLEVYAAVALKARYNCFDSH
jgi:hypothetical protein